MSEPEAISQPQSVASWITRVPIWARILVPAAVLVLIVVVIIVAVVGTHQTFTVRGVMEITSTSINDNGDGTCSGGLGYNDVDNGTEVVVTDQHGSTIAIGKLGKSKLANEGLSCDWKFQVANVPAGANFYGVEVGHRGSVKYTEKQLRKGIGLSLG